MTHPDPGNIRVALKSGAVANLVSGFRRPELRDAVATQGIPMIGAAAPVNVTSRWCFPAHRLWPEFSTASLKLEWFF